MRVQIQLVHAEAGRRVVLASAHDAQLCLASALGEASSAEEAEDRARSRLAQQLNTPERGRMPAPPGPAPVPAPTSKPAAPVVSSNPGPQLPLQVSAPSDAPEQEHEPPQDPDDWSSELASLELQLRRIGWDRDQEASYLQRAFGHGSRARLTRYSDLVAYLRALEALGSNADPASCPVPLRRADLLQQSDQLLRQLGWDAARGKALLESRFQRSSRQQLNDSQLLAFNMELEGELISSTGAAG